MLMLHLARFKRICHAWFAQCPRYIHRCSIESIIIAKTDCFSHGKHFTRKSASSRDADNFRNQAITLIENRPGQ